MNFRETPLKPSEVLPDDDRISRSKIFEARHEQEIYHAYEPENIKISDAPNNTFRLNTHAIKTNSICYSIPPFLARPGPNPRVLELPSDFMNPKTISAPADSSIRPLNDYTRAIAVKPAPVAKSWAHFVAGG